MKRSLFVYAFTFLLSVGFAGIALGHSGWKPFTPAGSVATPVILDGLFGGDKKPDTAPKTKEHPINSDEAFAAGTKSHMIMPFNRADLYFSLSLPTDWQADVLPGSEKEMSQKILGDIARFSSPMIGTFRARVFVQGLHMQHEISAANWLKDYVLRNGYTPQSEIKETSRREAAISYIYISEGISYFVYTRAEISADVIMLARFEAPLPIKDYIKYLQFKSIDSFKLVYPKDEPVEAQKVYTVVDSIKFSYPESWEIVAPDFRDMNRLTVQLHNKTATGGIDGFISFTAVRRNRSTNLLAEVEKLKAYFGQDLNVDVEKMTISDESPAYDRFIFNRYEVYDIVSRKKGQSLQNAHLVLLGDKEWYIIIYLITQRQEEKLYSWARNVQSFDVILRSIK